jgi:hypothetical protein
MQEDVRIFIVVFITQRIEALTRYGFTLPFAQSHATLAGAGKMHNSVILVISYTLPTFSSKISRLSQLSVMDAHVQWPGPVHRCTPWLNLV